MPRQSLLCQLCLQAGQCQAKPAVREGLFWVSQPRGFPSSCPAASPPVRAQGSGPAHSAAMALAATRRPRGRLRSVMARTILGLDMVDTFTSSETCGERGGTQPAQGSTAEMRGRRLGSRQSPRAGRAGWGLHAHENPKLKSPSPSRFPRSQGWVVPGCRQSPGLQGAEDRAGAGPWSVSTEHGAVGAGKGTENEEQSLVCSNQHLELPPVLSPCPERARLSGGAAREHPAGGEKHPWGGTHHGERHELEDAAAAALLQAVHALLHEPLHKLGVGAGRLGPQDGGDEQEEVCCGDRETNIRGCAGSGRPGTRLGWPEPPAQGAPGDGSLPVSRHGRTPPRSQAPRAGSGPAIT